jgi:isoamylase
LDAPDWADQSHSLAATVALLGYRLQLHLMINAYWEALEFEIPALEAQEPWRRGIDTYRDPPEDFCGWGDAPPVPGSTYLVQPRSVVILLARAGIEAAS